MNKYSVITEPRFQESDAHRFSIDVRGVLDDLETYLGIVDKLPESIYQNLQKFADKLVKTYNPSEFNEISVMYKSEDKKLTIGTNHPLASFVSINPIDTTGTIGVSYGNLCSPEVVFYLSMVLHQYVEILNIKFDKLKKFQ